MTCKPVRLWTDDEWLAQSIIAHGEMEWILESFIVGCDDPAKRRAAAELLSKHRASPPPVAIIRLKESRS